jgi:carbon starvation protein CstA
MTGAVLAVQYGWPGGVEWVKLAVMVAAGAVTFVVTVHLVDRSFFAGLRSFWAQKNRL